MSRETKNILFSLFEDNFELPDQFNTDSLLLDTEFFDSLTIIQIIEIIHDNFGLEIKLKDIVLTDFDSIATLAKFVDSLKPA
jgi:acyl carrier protein